jgi:hypothetical protein
MLLLSIEIFLFTLLFHIVKVNLYNFQQISVKTRYDLTSAIISIVHSVIVVCMASYVYLDFMTNGTPMTHENITYLGHPGFDLVLNFTCGYLFYDFIWMIYYRAYTVSFIAHHIVNFIALYMALNTPYGKYVIFVCIFNEISTPFLNLNTIFCILKTHNIYHVNESIKKLNLIIFAIVFFIFRVCLLSWLFYNLILSYYPDNIITVFYGLFTGHYILNIYWFTLIIKKIKN